MSSLTLNPSGGSPVTVTVAEGGWDVEWEDLQVLERRYDGSGASQTINGSTHSLLRASVQSVPLTGAERAAVEDVLNDVGTIDISGDLLAATHTVRVTAISWDIGDGSNQEIVNFSVRETS